VSTSEQGRPDTRRAARTAADPGVQVEAEEIEDLEAPAETQQNLAGGQVVKPGNSLDGCIRPDTAI
jgi:hypothetical protein